MNSYARSRPFTKLQQAAAQLGPRFSLGRGPMFVLLLVITGFLVVVPLVTLLVASFRPAGALPFDPTALVFSNYVDVVASPSNVRIVLNTLGYAVGSLVLGLGIAGILSWLTERTDMPFVTPTRVMMYSVMSLPPLLVAFGWILLLNPGNGALNVWLKGWLGLANNPLSIYTIWSMVFVTGIAIVPTLWIMLSGVLRNMDPELEYAGMTSGVGGPAILRQITLPLVLPGLLSSVIYIFMILIQAFDIPLALGLTARVPVLATRIYLLATPEYEAPRYGLAATLGVMLLIIALLLVFAYLRMTRTAEKFQVVTGRGYRPRVIKLGTWRYLAIGFVVTYATLMALPLLMLLWTSFLPFYRTPSLEAWSSLSLDNYRLILDSPLVKRAIGNTAILVFGSATLCMLLSSLVSWFAVRSRARGARLLEILAFLPLTIPGVVMALALLLFYARTPLHGTIWLLVLAHVTIFLAFGTRAMSGALMQIHGDLEHAGTVSGATWWTSFRRIILPLVWPSFLNGWLWVVAHSMRDLTSPIILMTTQNVVMSSALFLVWNHPNITGGSALAMLMTLALMAIVVPSQLLLGRSKVAAG